MEILSAIAGKWTILLAILFFGLIILVHEAGHFSFAKLFKVKVNEFSIGMGPKILSRKKGETRYSWRLLPIGGYVSMEGEDEDSEDERAFNNIKCWKRIIIVVAGAVINIVLGLIIVAVMLGISDSYSGTRFVHSFVSGEKSVTEMNGLKSKDKILKIDGKNVFYYTDVYYLASRDTGTTSDVTVIRDGEKIELNDIVFPSDSIIMLGRDKNAKTIFSDTFKESASICRMVWLSLYDMVTGKYSVKDISGPVGVVSMVSEVAESSAKTADYTSLLSILAVITINIGLFNLLPLPALDGGRLLFLLIELVRRKPVNRKYESWINAAGMILLLTFMAAITFKDIWVLVKGG